MIGSPFKTKGHYVFDYKPRYYDERKERIESLKKKYANDSDGDVNLSKLSISKQNLRNDWARHKKSANDRGTTIRLAVIISILVGLVAYFFEIHKLF